MADTIQLVMWSLQQRCKLRDGPATTTPELAAESVAKARAYSAGLRDNRDGFGVFGDVYVSCYTSGRRPGERKTGALPNYPSGGFVVSHEFRKFGGPQALFGMCASCPANTFSHELAGCAGSIHQRPDSPETEAQLRSIASRLGLDTQLHDAFPATTPLWYGLWAVSPVPQSSLGLLRTLISEMLTEDKTEMELAGKVDDRQLRDFARLVKAVEIAEQRDIGLHVSLLPLGHTDFGIHTIFPHCPFCKATARTERWQRKYPAIRQKCRVCGTEFSPAETATAKRMKWERDELRDTLGEQRFVQFAREYLIALGESPEAAEGIVLETEAEEKRRCEKRKQESELRAAKDRYLHSQILSGLPRVAPPPSDLEDDEVDESPEASVQWFDAENFAEALRRSLAAGISVAYMTHHSSSGELDKHQWSGLSDPLAVLEDWRAEGCSEKFSAGFRVPDAFVRDSTRNG